MISFERDTVTRVRAPLVTDEYGQPTSQRDWTAATRTDINGCGMQPLPGYAYTLDRDAVVTRWRLVAPPDADLVSTDRIEWGGSTYEVDGDVESWSSPTGNLAHIKALLTRRSG